MARRRNAGLAGPGLPGGRLDLLAIVFLTCLWRIDTEADFHALQEQEYGAPSEDSQWPRWDQTGRSLHVYRLNQRTVPDG
jgi:hypothetical protein